MRIGYDAKRYAQNATGLGNYARTLIHTLAQNAPQLELHLFSPVPLDARLTQGWLPPQSVVHAPVRTCGRIGQHRLRFVQVREDARRLNLNLYHGLSNVLPAKLPCPSVVTIHDLAFLHSTRFHGAVDRWIHLRRARAAVRRAKLIFTVSQATRAALIQSLDVRPEAIHVTYQSAGPQYTLARCTSTERARVRKKHCLPQHYMLAVGTLEQRKNPLRILHAFARVAKQIEDVTLIFVGRETHIARSVHRCATALRLGKRVRFLGALPAEDLPPLYAEARFALYLALVEGFGLPVLEAMLCGVPCLISDCSSMPEVGGEAALQVNPLDEEAIAAGMLRLWEDASYREDLRSRMPAQCALFAPQRVAQRVLEGYQRACGAGLALAATAAHA